MTLASLTLVAKAVSFFKEAVVASHFGIADQLDAFVLSFTVLSFIAAMLGAGMPDSFLPVFARVFHQQGAEKAHRLGLQTALCNLTAFLIVASFLSLSAEPIVRLMSRGFNHDKQEHAVNMLRNLLPFFVASGMTYHFSVWLRAQKLFVFSAFSPIVAPSIIIVVLLWSGSQASISLLVLATNVGVMLHCLLLIFAVLRTLPPGRRWARGVIKHWSVESAEVLRNTLPFLLAGVVIGSAPVIDQIMASWLQPGSVAVLGYSEKITSIVLALTAMPAGEALFPFFAEAVARKEWLQIRSHLVQITGLILVVVVPLTLLICLFSPFVVRLLFERGAFSAQDTARVAAVLSLGVFQTPFYIASSLACRLAVTLQASRFMLVMAALSWVVNVVFNAVLMQWFGVAGIALSTVVVHCFSAVAFYTFVLHRIKSLIGEEELA